MICLKIVSPNDLLYIILFKIYIDLKINQNLEILKART